MICLIACLKGQIEGKTLRVTLFQCLVDEMKVMPFAFTFDLIYLSIKSGLEVKPVQVGMK